MVSHFLDNELKIIKLTKNNETNPSPILFINVEIIGCIKLYNIFLEIN